MTNDSYRDGPPLATPELAAQTQAIYGRQAKRFDAERSRALHERDWLDRFLASVPRGGRILDLGCGAGEPITAYFLGEGYDVVGLDASSEMLALAGARFPSADWVLGDMRTLDLRGPFDGVVAWNSFFHLMPSEQREVLGRIARLMAGGASLLLTVGDREGAETGWVGDEVVYHASLSPEEYRSVLVGLRVEVVDFVKVDPTCGDQTVLLGRKRSGS